MDCARIFKYFPDCFPRTMLAGLPLGGSWEREGGGRLNKPSVFCCFHKPTNNFCPLPSGQWGIIRIEGEYLAGIAWAEPRKYSHRPTDAKTLHLLRNTAKHLARNTSQYSARNTAKQPTSTLDARSINCMLWCLMVAMVAQRGNGPTARPVRLICIVAAGNYHFYSKRHNQRNHGLFPGYASMLHMEAGEAKMNPTSAIFWLHL